PRSLPSSRYFHTLPDGTSSDDWASSGTAVVAVSAIRRTANVRNLRNQGGGCTVGPAFGLPECEPSASVRNSGAPLPAPKEGEMHAVVRRGRCGAAGRLRRTT